MIKCPNCTFENIDGTLLCEQCFWDIADAPRTEGEPAGGGVPPAAAPAAEAPFADAPLLEAPLVDMPLEAAPADAALALEAAPADFAMEAAPALDVPLEAAPPAEVPLEAFAEMPMGEAEAPPADAGLGLEAGLAPEMPPLEGLAEIPPGEAPAPAEGMGEVSAVEAAAAAVEGEAAAPAEEAALPAAPATKAPVMSQFPPARPVPEGLLPKLMVVRGLKPNAEYPLVEGANFIGRFDELPVDVDLTDQEEKGNMRSSRQHACITFEGQMLQLEDLSSANGTYLNRIKIAAGEKVPLSVGDYVQTGTVMFRVKT